MPFDMRKFLCGMVVVLMVISPIAAATIDTSSSAMSVCVGPDMLCDRTAVNTFVTSFSTDTTTATTSAVSSVPSTTSARSEPTSFSYSGAAQSVVEIIGSMNSAGDGFVHIADDGVVRAYAANGTVIDYVKLSNSQLRAFVDSLPPSIQDQREHLLDIWGDVDGNKVTDEGQIWNPPVHLQPVSTQDEAQTQAPAPPQSSNPAYEAAGSLGARSFGPPYCQGSPCTNGAACAIMGCIECIKPDNFNNKVCL